MRGVFFCWICRQRVEGVGVAISMRARFVGEGSRVLRRFAAERLIGNLCLECANHPGGRFARPRLWRLLRDGILELIAHIANKRNVEMN